MTLRSSSTRILRLSLALVTAGAFLGAATVSPAPAHSAPTSTPRTALYCEPPFSTLPGCSSEEDGDEPSTGTGSWSSSTIAGMAVELYTPTTAPALNNKRALMISLHGCAQSSTVFKAGSNWQSTADEYGMVVAIPAAPNGGVLLGCWDYYDSNQTRSTRHNDNLIDLANALKSQTALNIDPTQVYISGLSSGAGQSMVMACLAPDVFAGVGLNAGPTIGTSSGQISSVSTSLSSASALCTNWAATNTASLSTQLTSVIYGSNDSTVAPGYNTLNASVMAQLYNANTQSTFALSGLAGTNTAGSGTIYADTSGPRVSIIQNTGLGHSWPAGGGSGSSYISTNSINYPAYLTEFFFENNRRVDRSSVPTPTPTPTETSTPDPTPTPTPTPTETSTPEPTPTPTETTPSLYCGSATNAEHKAAGRAISYGIHPYNPYYAVGSQNYLGQGDFTVTTLSQSAQGTYIMVSSCP